MDTQFCIIEPAVDLEQWLLSSSLHVSKQMLKKYLDLKRLRGRKLCNRQEVTLPLNLLNAQDVTPNYQGPQVQIIFEDATFLVVNKPPMIHSLAQQYEDGDSLSSWLRLNYPHQYQRFLNLEGKNLLDRGALYRLDYETSGVFIFIKIPAVYQKMRLSFSNIVQQKIYLAIVQGVPTWDRLVLDLGMMAVGESGRKIIAHHSPYPSQYSATVTHLEVAQRFPLVNKTLIKAVIQTGHRHQIRVACKESGFPLWADAFYGEKEEGHHFCLHAHHYQLKWEGKVWDFQSHQPDTWPI